MHCNDLVERIWHLLMHFVCCRARAGWSRLGSGRARGVAWTVDPLREHVQPTCSYSNFNTLKISHTRGTHAAVDTRHPPHQDTHAPRGTTPSLAGRVGRRSGGQRRGRPEHARQYLASRHLAIVHIASA